jgi:heavy metal sensor kinase
VSRLSLRIRLTLVFAAVMAVVLLASGVFVYERVGSSLSASVTRTLRVRADDVSAALAPGGRTDPHDFDGAEGVAQLVTPDGRVLRGTPGATGASLIARSRLQDAAQGTIVVDRMAPKTLRAGPLRVLAEPVSGRHGEIAVVAESLLPRHQALERLLAELLIAGAAGLALASLAGYGLAAAALRPVDAMSRQAADISLHGSTTRLPVPASRDEIAKLGTRLNEMLERMENAFAHERRFLADASHELRTPIAVLRTELEIALRRPRSRQELEDVVRSAQAETERLAALAEDLLVVAQADQGRLRVEPVRVGAAELLDEVAARFAATAAEHRREILVEAPGSLHVVCDRRRVEQALGNLVDNSLRYGGGTIVLGATATPRAVELHVRDAGGGFPAAFLPRAFERFSRPAGQRSAPGSGLGLAIVDAIARAHGGRAEVANAAGGGADVWIALPRRR